MPDVAHERRHVAVRHGRPGPQPVLQSVNGDPRLLVEQVGLRTRTDDRVDDALHLPRADGAGHRHVPANLRNADGASGQQARGAHLQTGLSAIRREIRPVVDVEPVRNHGRHPAKGSGKQPDVVDANSAPHSGSSSRRPAAGVLVRHTQRGRGDAALRNGHLLHLRGGNIALAVLRGHHAGHGDTLPHLHRIRRDDPQTRGAVVVLDVERVAVNGHYRPVLDHRDSSVHGGLCRPQQDRGCRGPENGPGAHIHARTDDVHHRRVARVNAGGPRLQMEVSGARRNVVRIHRLAPHADGRAAGVAALVRPDVGVGDPRAGPDDAEVGVLRDDAVIDRRLLRKRHAVLRAAEDVAVHDLRSGRVHVQVGLGALIAAAVRDDDVPQFGKTASPRRDVHAAPAASLPVRRCHHDRVVGCAEQPRGARVVGRRMPHVEPTVELHHDAVVHQQGRAVVHRGVIHEAVGHTDHTQVRVGGDVRGPQLDFVAGLVACPRDRHDGVHPRPVEADREAHVVRERAAGHDRRRAVVGIQPEVPRTANLAVGQRRRAVLRLHGRG